MDLCPCGTNLPFSECCEPLIRGLRSAETAEQLMRSRYSAYANKEIAYLFESLHPGHRSDYDEKSTSAWAESSEWRELRILNTTGGNPDDTEGTVEFIAVYTEKGIKKEHHETASFSKDNGKWYFVTGEGVPPKQFIRAEPKTGRNDPCPCGSGRKYKKCCAL